MIAFIKGKIIAKSPSYLIIAAANVGYKVYVNPAFYAEASLADELELFTYQHVREDSLDLYGFPKLSDLDLFEMLLSVSGVGPKSALNVMAMDDSENLKAAIMQGDSALLTKVSGIGRKTAERVVLELKEKIAKLEGPLGAQPSILAASDEIDALMALGYSLIQAREALSRVDKSITDSSKRVKQALKEMSN